MNHIARFTVAPSNVAEIKAGIFSFHSKKKVEFKDDESFVYEDDFYRVELKGFKLNQIHRDILDIILYCGGKEFDGKLKDNRFVRTISLYKIKEHLGYSSSNNIRWIEQKIDEIQQTLIEVTAKTSPNQETWKFSAIETAKHSKKLNTYAVIIHPLYCNFFMDNISLDYSHYLKEILALQNGVTKAAIRYLLTHKGGMQINVDKLLAKIGVEGTKRNIEKQRVKLLKELEGVKETFNIEFIKTTSDMRRTGDTTIRYARLPEIRFYYPQNEEN